MIKDQCVCSNIQPLSSLLKIIAEENRLKLICVLCQQEYCVCELMPIVKLSQSLISHHLADLKEANLVADKKRGQKVYYRLTELGENIMQVLPQLKISA